MTLGWNLVFGIYHCSARLLNGQAVIFFFDEMLKPVQHNTLHQVCQFERSRERF
jgi:hypothetical protein